jgi:hypothetical protein
MGEVDPLLKEYLPHMQQLCELAKTNVLDLIDQGKPVRININAKRNEPWEELLSHKDI